MVNWVWLFVVMFCVLLLMVVGGFIALAPHIVLHGITYLALGAFFYALYRISATEAPVWVRALFVVTLASFVLNYGFSNFSVGVGSMRATVPELVLMISLGWIMVRSWSALWIGGGVTFALLLYALPPLVVHLPSDLATYGIVAARDALPLLDSLFLFGGVAVVAFARDKQQWFAWRHRFYWILLCAMLVYLPLYPFQEQMLSYSPRVTGYQQAVPLIGYYATGNVLALAGLLAVILIPGQFAWVAADRPRRWVLGLAFFVYALGLLMMQSRGTYIVAGLSVFLLAFGGYGLAVRRLVLMGAVLIGTLAAIDFSGVEIEGRVGNIGLQMLTAQLESVTGEGGLESARGGVDQRKRWVADSLSRWAGDYKSVIAGIGFGMPLTDFAVAGAGGKPVQVREPHNSYVSVLTRTGLMGFIPWLIFQMAMVFKVWGQFMSCRRRGEQKCADFWLWIFLLFVSILVTAFVQPAFESPQYAVPYFVIAGMCLGEIARDRTNWIPIVRLRQLENGMARV